MHDKIKRKFLLSLMAGMLLVAACSETRKRSGPHMPASPGELVTGCYYITADTSMPGRYLPETKDVCFIDPHPIVTVDHFRTLKKEQEQGIMTIRVDLDEQGTAAWAEATGKYAGKRIAVIVRNKLLLAPVVQGRIDGGSFVISGGFSDEQLDGIYQQLDAEMYEPR